jgi:uncharacterized protein YegP (UPF0339 family)
MNPRSTTTLLLLLALFAGISGGCAAPIADPSAPSGGSSELGSVPYFDLFTGADGDVYWNLKAANHEVILSSQGYTSRTGAVGGVLSVLDNAELPYRYDLKQAADGQYYFLLKAGNGHTIGMSEMYSTASNARRGIETVSANVGAFLDYQATRTGERFDVFQGNDGRYYWNLHAGNGEIVLSGQGYSTEAAAYNGAFAVADNGTLEERYDVRESADGGFYFNLKAANGHIIGTSEVYSTRSNAERARGSIIELLPSVDIL